MELARVGVEPTTLALLAPCSNRLSYPAMFNGEVLFAGRLSVAWNLQISPLSQCGTMAAWRNG
ncbi:hypothetical protein M514_21713 [Trichuris suis]|uniref:Uncharacterized protein n=1 Tax=Trichuris suis TaxID=68888 RepID=A0A085N991_9BILA|nr:hypothetical protein M514_21713 [Trichuris suis]